MIHCLKPDGQIPNGLQALVAKRVEQIAVGASGGPTHIYTPLPNSHARIIPAYNKGVYGQ